MITGGGASRTRRLDAWAETAWERRFPRLATLTASTVYRFLAVAMTLAWLVLRIPSWGSREVRFALRGAALSAVVLCFANEVVTRVRHRTRR